MLYATTSANLLASTWPNEPIEALLTQDEHIPTVQPRKLPPLSWHARRFATLANAHQLSVWNHRHWWTSRAGGTIRLNGACADHHSRATAVFWTTWPNGSSKDLIAFAAIFVRYFRLKKAYRLTNTLPFKQKYFIIECLGTNSFQIFVVCLARNFMPCYVMARFYAQNHYKTKI